MSKQYVRVVKCCHLHEAWMGTCGRYLWHIYVIHEDQQSLPHRRPVDLFSPFLNIGLQVPLEVQ